MLPDYSQSGSNRVKLFIPKGSTDKAFIQMISEEQKRLGRMMPIYSLLILNILKSLSRMSLQDLSEEFKIPESKIRVTLETLAASGMVEAVGNGRGRYYLLSSKYYKNTAEYIRTKDIDPIRYEELVLQLIKKKGDGCRADVVELLHVTPPQAYRVLKKLDSEGKIKRIGSGPNTKYVIN